MTSPDERTRALREASKAFFGQEHRLAVMSGIGRHPTGTFTLSEIATLVGVTSASSVQGSLAALARLGLIERVQTSADYRSRRYRRVAKSTAWDFAEELQGRVLATLPGTLPLS